MVRDYEIRVAGPIGPFVAFSLPGLTVTALPTSTGISGTGSSASALSASVPPRLSITFFAMRWSFLKSMP